MKKYKRIVLFIVSMALTAVFGYYTIEVIKARVNTPIIVDSYYKSGKIKVTAKELSQRQLDILLEVEDPDFYHHHGVDFRTPGAGWTTITQGLAKQFYFEHFEQGLMKIKQTLCARLALDPLVNKETQITLYINMLYYGNGVYGLYDAANYYFHKTVPELDEDEYITLIASLINPQNLNVKDHPKENAQRVQRIKKVLSGKYSPNGLFDITYVGADNNSDD